MVQQAEMEMKARRLIEPSRLPDSLYGNKLDSNTKLKLAMGERVFFPHIEVPSDNGAPAFVRSGTIRLTDEGGIKFHTDFTKDNLDIPDTLFGKPLTQQQIEALESNKTLGPLKDEKGQEVYVSVDRKTNCVTIESPYTLKVPDELMGFKLTEQDKNAWVNGELLQPRVYEHKGEHFIANVQKNDKGGITIIDATFLKPHEVSEAKARYNTAVGKETNPLSKEKETKRVAEQNNGTDPLMEAIKAKDFTAIAKLGTTTTAKPEHTEFIEKNYSPAEKAGADALLKREQPTKGEKAIAPREEKERVANNQKSI